MSERPPTPAGAVEVPGPSLRSEGRTRIAIERITAAIAGLQGAADAVRSLGR